MKKLTIGRLLLLSFFSLLFLSKAFGCQCFGRPTVLDAFEQSEDVFIGDVTGIEKGDPLMYRGGIKGARITTDSTGLYEIYDVSPGQYLIEPDIPLGWKLNGYMLDRRFQGPDGGMSEALARYLDGKDLKPNQFPIDVQAGRHVGFDFQYEIDNAISGRLLGPDGKPLKGICVHAIPPSREDSLYGYTDCTNAEGKFEITSLSHSEYVLVINGDGKISGKSPLPKTFFPGVQDRSKATIIKMGPGIKPDVGDFRVPKILETVVLRGMLLFSNGKPVQSRTVQFVPDDPSVDKKSYVFYTNTKQDGTFELVILKGQTGRLRGEYYTGKKILEACPEWKKANIEPDKTADWMIRAATDWIDIKADHDLKNIKFVFPFNECESE